MTKPKWTMADANKEAYATLQLMQATGAPIDAESMRSVLKGHSGGAAFVRSVVARMKRILVMRYSRRCDQLTSVGDDLLSRADASCVALAERIKALWPYERPAQGLHVEVRMWVPGSPRCAPPDKPYIVTTHAAGATYSRHCTFRKKKYTFTVHTRPSFRFSVENGDLVAHNKLTRQKWRLKHGRGFTYFFEEEQWPPDCSS